MKGELKASRQAEDRRRATLENLMKGELKAMRTSQLHVLTSHKGIS